MNILHSSYCGNEFELYKIRPSSEIITEFLTILLLLEFFIFNIKVIYSVFSLVFFIKEILQRFKESFYVIENDEAVVRWLWTDNAWGTASSLSRTKKIKYFIKSHTGHFTASRCRKNYLGRYFVSYRCRSSKKDAAVSVSGWHWSNTTLFSRKKKAYN